MATVKKTKSKFITRRRNGKTVKLYGAAMKKVLESEKKKHSGSRIRKNRVTAAKRNSIKVKFITKNGRRLYGAAMQKVLDARKKRAKKRNFNYGAASEAFDLAGRLVKRNRRNAEQRSEEAGRQHLRELRRDTPNHKKFYVLFADGKMIGTANKSNAIFRAKHYSNLNNTTVKIESSTGDFKTEIKPGRATSSRPPRKRNLDHRDAAHPIEVRRYWQGRKGYMTEWQRAHQAGQRQLFRMNRGKRKRNSALMVINGKGRKRNGLYEEFHGEDPTSISQDLAPDGTPDHVDVLGKLERLYYQEGDERVPSTGKTEHYLEFGVNKEECPKLASNQKGNRFYIVGNLPKFTPNGVFGTLTRIEYCARKPHLEGHDKEVHYWHAVGEENGIRPILETDHDGLLVIKGGDYRTTADGIIN